jgi:methionyl-tRNA synthetase
MTKPFYITTPIFYVNAEPHIGHTYTSVITDTIARYHRLAGEDTFYLTGTDEHGDKISQAAEAKGESTQAFADHISGVFRSTWDELDFSYDRFIRTTEPAHIETVQHILQKVYDAGDIELREYSGQYCVGCERFLTDRDLDEEGRCKDHEKPPEERKETNYFFLMSRYTDWLAEHIETNPGFIRPAGYAKEVLSMLHSDSGLEDLCISRPKERLQWGIPLPFDTDYVCYVWFDALINYLTGINYPDDLQFEARWSNVEHIIGKDILKPHGVFWPTILKAAGLPVYQHLNVHGFWNVDNRKVSKSLGNMISPLAMRERYGFESFRYFLLREMSFGRDASFSEEALVTRVNADLSKNLGNLESRCIKMLGRFREGIVPEPGAATELEQGLQELVKRIPLAVDEQMRNMEPHRALASVFELVDATNKYIDTRAPWKLAKETDSAESMELLDKTLYTVCEMLRVIALLLAPFLPETASRILERLGLSDALKKAELPQDAQAWGGLPAGNQTQSGEPLFPRLEMPAAEDAN